MYQRRWARGEHSAAAVRVAAADFGSITQRVLAANKARVGGVLVLWVLGFVLMSGLIPTGFEVTPEARREYNRIVAQEGKAEEIYAAEQGVYMAELEYSKVNAWFWRWRGEEVRAPAARAMEELTRRQRDLDAAERDRDNALRKARSVIGIWSDQGVDEARSLFWQSYSDGKLFAQRQTFWDMIFTALDSRNSNVWGLVLRWLFTFVSNFTAGMLGALFIFTWRVLWFLWQYSPNIISGAAFFVVAVFAAVSTVAAYLVGLYGAAAGGVYVVAKMRNLAIDNGGGDPRRRQAPQFLRGQHAYHQRSGPHQD